MKSWSFVCALQLGASLSLINSKCFDYRASRRLVNIYYVLPTRDKLMDQNYLNNQHKCIQNINKLVRTNFILYRLSKEDFYANLWESTGKLLIVFDDLLSEEFMNDFSVVSF